METTCAACGLNVTNLHPWWFDVSMLLAFVAIVVALALINWQRWRDRS